MTAPVGHTLTSVASPPPDTSTCLTYDSIHTRLDEDDNNMGGGGGQHESIYTLNMRDTRHLHNTEYYYFTTEPREREYSPPPPPPPHRGIEDVIADTLKHEDQDHLHHVSPYLTNHHQDEQGQDLRQPYIIQHTGGEDNPSYLTLDGGHHSPAGSSSSAGTGVIQKSPVLSDLTHLETLQTPPVGSVVTSAGVIVQDSREMYDLEQQSLTQLQHHPVVGNYHLDGGTASVHSSPTNLSRLVMVFLILWRVFICGVLYLI